MKFVGNSVPEYPAALFPSNAQDIADKAYVDLFIPNTFIPQANYTVGTTQVSTAGTSGTNVSSTSFVYVGAQAASTGPVVTMTTGSAVLVEIGASLAQTTGAAWALMSFAVSGATTLAAHDDRSVNFKAGTISSVNVSHQMTYKCYVTGLTPGSNTFTAQYAFGTSGTASFTRRILIVQRLN